MERDPEQARRRRLLYSLFLVLAVACSSTAQQAVATGAVTPTITNALPTITSTILVNASGEISIPNAQMQYYDVVGSTEGELRAELDAKGPVGYDGYKGDSATRWFVGWTWPGYGTIFCTFSAPTVWYQITVIFPRWRAPANAPPPLISKWAKFEEALGRHEEGHVDFVVTRYPSVATAIEQANCSTAETAAQDALKPIRQHDIDYDTETNHGATQGARFP